MGEGGLFRKKNTFIERLKEVEERSEGLALFCRMKSLGTREVGMRTRPERMKESHWDEGHRLGWGGVNGRGKSEFRNLHKQAF